VSVPGPIDHAGPVLRGRRRPAPPAGRRAGGRAARPGENPGPNGWPRPPGCRSRSVGTLT